MHPSRFLSSISCHSVKSVQMWSYFWSVFGHFSHSLLHMYLYFKSLCQYNFSLCLDRKQIYWEGWQCSLENNKVCLLWPWNYNTSCINIKKVSLEDYVENLVKSSEKEHNKPSLLPDHESASNFILFFVFSKEKQIDKAKF